MSEGVVDDLEMIEVEIEDGNERFAPLGQRNGESQMLLKKSAVGQAGEGVVVSLIFEMLLRALSIGEVADVADDAGDIVPGIVLRAENRGDPSLPVAAKDVVVGLGERNGLTVECPAQYIIHALLAEVRKKIGGRLAEDLVAGQAGELLHESIPHQTTQTSVVDNDALAGVRGDVAGQLAGVALSIGHLPSRLAGARRTGLRRGG